MKHVLRLIALLAFLPTTALAQGLETGDRIVSIAVLGGGLTPVAEFSDGSQFLTGGTFGGALTLWPTESVGIRASVLRGKTEVDSNAGAGLNRQDPTVWYYTGDVIGRPNIQALRQWGWSPYVFAGLGIKSYSFAAAKHIDKTSDFAAQLGAGLEYRYGPAGLQLEARGVASPFKHLGYNDTQRDLVYTAGITLSL